MSSIEEIAGELYNKAASAWRDGDHGLKMLSIHIPTMLGKNQWGRPIWQHRIIPPEGKVVKLDRFLDYLLKKPRDGLGVPSLHLLRGNLEGLGKEGSEALQMLRAEIPKFDEMASRSELVMKAMETPPVASHQEAGAKGGKGKKAIDNVNSFPESGNHQTYLLARMKRDRPDLVEALKAGKYRSVRAAALEAGIVRPTATVYVDSPEAAIQGLLRRFTKEQLLKALESHP